MSLIRKTFASSMDALGLGPRQIRAVCSTGEVDREGDVIAQEGIDLRAFRSNPIVLAFHSPSSPVGRAVQIGLSAGKLTALIEFAPQGVSATADEVCGLTKAGILNGISIGFSPIEAEPMDAKRPRGPRRFLRSELMELSIVAIPANTGASVIERRIGDRYAEESDVAARQAAKRKRQRQVEALRLQEVPLSDAERARAKRLRQVEVLNLIAGIRD